MELLIVLNSKGQEQAIYDTNILCESCSVDGTMLYATMLPGLLCYFNGTMLTLEQLTIPIRIKN